MHLPRDERAPVAVPVALEGSDQLRPAMATGCTLDVSVKGARVQCNPDWEIGDLIWVERRQRRAQFRVVWIGGPGTPHQRQIGIECMDEQFDWGFELPQKAVAATASAASLPAR